MEDFVGRGDRRLSQVVRRAWELGAGMDSWWESLDNAYAAWAQAIDEAGLSWKYRQVESGEWNLFDEPDTERTEAEVAAESDRLTQQLEAPLPWDHLDTGIDKQWLRDDLLKALEAATVPDCSFDGCSHCGVCGLDFGHNVVVPPMEIPKIQRTSKPDNTRAQRLQIHFGKQGSMTLISHLDMMRLFDRALRRASLPISFTGGFHPGPRIAPANALPLGMSSSAELVDIELTRPMDPEEFRAQLAAQLPPELSLYSAKEVSIKDPSVAQQLNQAEYLMVVEGHWADAEQVMAKYSTSPKLKEAEAEANDETVDEASSIAPTPIPQEQWQPWIESLMATTEVELAKTSKSGKVKVFNGRDRLHQLELLSPEAASTQGWPLEANQVALRYIGSCRNDGTLLRPEQLLMLFEKNAQPVDGNLPQLQLIRAHRNRLILEQPTPKKDKMPSSTSSLSDKKSAVKTAPFKL